MKIILKKDVDNLGFKYDLLEVKDGYALNYLFPRGEAVLADQSALKVRNEDLKQKSKKDAQQIKKAKKEAQELEKLEIIFRVKASKEGKIFGSITNQDLASFFEEKNFAIEKKYIKIMGAAIKNLGKYKALIRLHREVETSISFEVLAEIQEEKNK